MKKIFILFLILREERWLVLAELLVLSVLNTFSILKYYDKFSTISKNYFNLFVHTFHISGFDPITYVVVSHWFPSYNIYRHPLLAFFMYIPYQITMPWYGLQEWTVYSLLWLQYWYHAHSIRSSSFTESSGKSLEYSILMPFFCHFSHFLLHTYW